MKSRAVLMVTAIFVTMLLSGCGGWMLTHTTLPSASPSVGSVSLIVKNARPKDMGAENDNMVGRVRNLYGMPIKREAKNTVTEAITAVFSEALGAAGYTVAASAPAQVTVDVTEFFMDGYVGYKITSMVDVKAGKGAPTFQSIIKKEHSFVYKRSKDIPQAYKDTLDKITQDAVAAFKTPEFAAAVK